MAARNIDPKLAERALALLAEELDVQRVLALLPDLSAAELRELLRRATGSAAQWCGPGSAATSGTPEAGSATASRTAAARHSPAAKGGVSQPLDSALVYTLHTDGAARGNPGPAGSGAVLFDPSGAVVHEFWRYLGEVTNNVAEYQALLDGLEAALERGVARLEVRSDSELLCHQINGIYRVKDAKLRPLYERAVKLAAAFQTCRVRHVRREQNRDADALANRAIDDRTP